MFHPTALMVYSLLVGRSQTLIFINERNRIMKKTVFFLFANLVLLCSCEKFGGHYTYETTVPNTTIKESQLDKVISLDDFLSVTDASQKALIFYMHTANSTCL